MSSTCRDGRIDGAGYAAAPPATVHETVYGHGYATFTMQRSEVELELDGMSSCPNEPVEIWLLTIRNRTGEPRRFRVVPYFEMALAGDAGDTRWPAAGAHRYRRKAYYLANPGQRLPRRLGLRRHHPGRGATRSMCATASAAA